MIKIKSLTKKIKSTIILNAVSFNLPSKGLFLINGENGSGKTTLLNIICGLDSDYEGEVYFDNINFTNLTDKERSNFIYNNISYVRQKGNLIDFLGFKKNKSILDLLNGDKKSIYHDEAYSKYSQGQQKLMILDRALKKKASVYIFDEPFNELSDSNCNEILKKLEKKSNEALVLIVSHDERSNVIKNQISITNKKIVNNFDCTSNGEIQFINTNHHKIKISSLIHNFFLKNILSFFTLFLLQILTLSMFMATCNTMSNYYKSYLREIIDNTPYVNFQTKKEVNIKNDYIYVNSVNNNGNPIYIYQSTKFLDKYAYCNKNTYSQNNNEISFNYNMKSYTFKVKLSTDIKYDGFFLSADFEKYGLSYDDDAFYVNYGKWNNDNKPVYLGTNSLKYMSCSYVRKNYVLSNNFSVDDDEIITNDSNLISSNRTDFQRIEYTENEDTFIDMNSIYPSGVKITYLQLNIEKNDSIAIVSDNKLKEISSLMNQIKFHYIFVENNKNEIIDFLCKNNISKIGFDSTLYSKDYEKLNRAYNLYSLSISRINDKSNISYSMSYFIPSYIAYNVLTILIFYAVISKNKTNNMILKSFGINKFKRYLVFYLPFIILTFLTTIISYFISLLLVYKSDLIFVFYFSWLTTTLMITSFLLFMFVGYLLTKKG